MSTSLATNSPEWFGGGGKFDDFDVVMTTQPTAGSLLVCTMVKQENGRVYDNYRISDTVDGTWNVAIQYEPGGSAGPGSEAEATIWYVENCGGGARTITIGVDYVSGGSMTAGFEFFEVTSSAGTLAYVTGSAVSAQNESSATISAGTLTFNNDSDNFLVTAAVSSTDPTVGTNWTLGTDWTLYGYGRMQYQLDATSTEPCDYGNSAPFAAAAAAFEVPAAGGATPKGVFGLPLQGPTRRVVY